MTVSWSFSNLKANPLEGNLTNVIVSVDYRIAYYESGSPKCSYSAGTAVFTPPDPDAFTDFNEISEATMVAFVETLLGDELETIQAQLKAAYDNPVVEMPLPWNDVDTEEAD